MKQYVFRKTPTFGVSIPTIKGANFVIKKNCLPIHCHAMPTNSLLAAAALRLQAIEIAASAM
jgi:hypothetical protein